MRFLIFFSILLLGASACNTTKKTVDTDSTDIKNMKVSPEDLVFKLKKTACFGSCPQYDFRLYKNRYAEFIGKRFVDRIGTYGKMVSKETYKSLVKAFDEGNFILLEDFYPSQVADLPTTIITYNKGDIKKTISGKRERPEIVHKLQFALERVAEDDGGWVFISDDIDEEVEVKMNKAQIIVDIAAGNRLPRWFDKMKDQFGVQILKRLSNNSDSWLITYDTKDHKPEDVLKYLQSDPVVKSAEFKKKFRTKDIKAQKR